MGLANDVVLTVVACLGLLNADEIAQGQIQLLSMMSAAILAVTDDR